MAPSGAFPFCRHCSLLRCMSSLMAQSGHWDRAERRSLLGVKRTSQVRLVMSAFDPKRTTLKKRLPDGARVNGPAQGAV
jgi:hypothetical protein